MDTLAQEDLEPQDAKMHNAPTEADIVYRKAMEFVDNIATFKGLEPKEVTPVIREKFREIVRVMSKSAHNMERLEARAIATNYDWMAMGFKQFILWHKHGLATNKNLVRLILITRAKTLP